MKFFEKPGSGVNLLAELVPAIPVARSIVNQRLPEIDITKIVTIIMMLTIFSHLASCF